MYCQATPLPHKKDQQNERNKMANIPQRTEPVPRHGDFQGARHNTKLVGSQKPKDMWQQTWNVYNEVHHFAS